MALLKDCKLLSTMPASSAESNVNITGLSTSFLQLQCKKVIVSSANVVVLTKTGSVQKGKCLITSANSTDSGNTLTFQQFLVFLDNISPQIQQCVEMQQAKEIPIETVHDDIIINPRQEDIDKDLSHELNTSYLPYDTLERVFRKLCNNKSEELEIDKQLSTTGVCRGGMTRASKTAFTPGGALFIEGNIEAREGFSNNFSSKVLQLWNINAEQVSLYIVYIYI